MSNKKSTVIAEGFESLRVAVMPKGASQVQIDDCQRYYYAGAMKLLDSLVDVVGEGREPTTGDLEKLTAIYNELTEFFRGVEH